MTKETANRLINLVCTILSAIAALFCTSSCINFLTH